MALMMAGWGLGQRQAWAQNTNSAKKIMKPIPSSKEQIPVIGMGTWITFNVGSSERLRNARAEIMKEFFARGGAVIDSSPMYGSSEEVIGYGLKKLGMPKELFSASKIWTSSKSEGLKQFADSQKLWGAKKFDLFQVHNLDGWEYHLKTLADKKAAGELRYVGVTTSHGRRHDELESIMKKQSLDFVQVTYNLEDRRIEDRILKVAAERNIAVIANRPFDGGALFNRVKGKPLPSWAKEIDCANWAQIFLKFVVSHPNITVAIPATSQLAHMKENMGALYGKLPDESLRKKMIQHMDSL